MTRMWSAWKWAGIGLILLFDWAPGEVAGNGLDEAVDKLVAGLVSDSCLTRKKAMGEYPWRSDDGVREQAALRRRAKVLTGDMQARVVALADVMEDGRRGYARLLDLTREAARVTDGGGDKKKQAAALSRLRQRLLSVMQNPKEGISTRVKVPFLFARLSEYAAQFTSDWGQELPALLQSPDPTLRLIGAVTAMTKRLPKGSDPPKSLVTRILIENLSSEDVAARYLSQQTLFDVTGIRTEQLCFDPTDPPGARMTSMRRWEEWWKENEEQLSRDRIPQLFW